MTNTTTISRNFCNGFGVRYSGTKYTTDFRVFIENAERHCISPFHDIPLKSHANNFHMVCEIPRWTNAKFEISTSETMNPIKQDVKKGQVRFVKNLFPHHGYIWNYGAFPQTWEDPNHVDQHTGLAGDNDPIDVIEIGQEIAFIGQVKEVKVLGVLALLDEGETDWKVIAIDVRDPLAAEMHDVADVERLMPGLLKETIDWFKYYKVPDGKPVNTIGLGEKVEGREFALRVVEETNAAWKRLLAGEIPAHTDKYHLSIKNFSADALNRITDEEIAELAMSHSDATKSHIDEAAVDFSIHRNYFVARA